MRSAEIVRSWKDDEYRLSLNESVQSFLPDNPAGVLELSDEDLLGVAGGTGSWIGPIIIATMISIEYCTRGCR